MYQASRDSSTNATGSLFATWLAKFTSTKTPNPCKHLAGARLYYAGKAAQGQCLGRFFPGSSFSRFFRRGKDGRVDHEQQFGGDRVFVERASRTA